MGRRKAVGVLLLIIGAGLLLQELDILNFASISSVWWPFILIIIGFFQLTGDRSSKIPGLFFILIGLAFLARNVLDINVFQYTWPLLVIIVGLVFLFSRGYPHRHDHNTNTKNLIHHVSLFSGATIQSSSTAFKGGDLTAIFGGIKIDLRDVILSSEDAYLDITAVFGGVNLIIPDDMHVEISGTPIFGGWEDKTRRRKGIPDENAPTLHIKCMPVFGGVEIKD